MLSIEEYVCSILSTLVGTVNVYGNSTIEEADKSLLFQVRLINLIFFWHIIKSPNKYAYPFFIVFH